MVFFPCVYSIVVTHQNGHFSIAFPMFHACFTWLGIILPSPQCFHRCNQFSKRSTQIFHCFPILFPLFYVIFPHLFIVYSTIPTVAPHKRFFFPCVYSIVVTHQNGHFSIAFPMFHACFTWLGIILPSPQCFHRCNQFSKRSTQIFHCFPILFPLFYVIFPHLFIVYYGMKIALLTKLWQKLNFCTSHVCHLFLDTTTN